MAIESFEHESVEIDMDLSSDEIKDWGGEQQNFAPEVPPGEHVLSVVACKQDTSKKGNTMIVVDFEVAEGDATGKRVRNWYTLTEKAKGRIKRLMMCVGARLDKIRTDEIVGGKLRATIVHEEAPPQIGPDGLPKTDANGDPYPPSIFARVQNERPYEDPAATKANTQKAAPPPVTRGGGNKAATPNNQTRRA
jgi:hypothetical protein